MRYGPPFDFARRGDGRRLAYQVVGEGGLDLVFLLGWPTHLGLMWENPSFAAFLGKLSSFSRLILFDRLADGLSDRGPSGHSFDDEMDDLRRVLAAAGSERAAFFGCHTGGRLAMLAPGEADDPSVRTWFRMFSGSASSPMESVDGIRSLGPVDIRGLLGSIQAPVLVLHRTGDRAADVGASRYMAERIPGARFVELTGDDHLPFFGDPDTVVALTQEFLTGATPVEEPDRVLAAFDGPAKGIRAAAAIRSGLRDLGLEVRVGLHTGEVELLGDDIGGIAVHIAARVMAAARAGEILCSRTVKDLVAGSGFAFDDRGTHDLKGVPDAWQLHAVEPAGR